MTDRLENALDALGCPNPRSVAVLTMEVLPDLLEDSMPPTGAHLTMIRGERYGPPEINFTRTWHLIQPIIEAPHLTGAQRVALINLAQKLSRLIETPDDEDSIHDLAGYAATLDLLAGREPSV